MAVRLSSHEVVFALPELNLLVVLRVFMVSSSLINYKVPEFLPSHVRWDYQHNSF